MPLLPAFCTNCGAVFNGYYIGGGTAMLAGNEVGPCPVCGEMGEIPDGVFEATEETLRLISGPQQTVNRLKRLARILRRAQKEDLSVDEVQDELNENAPEFSDLGEIIRQYKGTLLNAILTVILAAITLQLGQMQHQSQMEEHEETQQLAEKTLKRARECVTEEDLDALMEEIEEKGPPDDTTDGVDSTSAE